MGEKIISRFIKKQQNSSYSYKIRKKKCAEKMLKAWNTYKTLERWEWGKGDMVGRVEINLNGPLFEFPKR